MKSNKSLQIPVLTATHILEWVHTTDVEKSRLLRHMQKCEKDGIALIAEMEGGKVGSNEHYSIATLGMDGERFLTDCIRRSQSFDLFHGRTSLTSLSTNHWFESTGM